VASFLIIIIIIIIWMLGHEIDPRAITDPQQQQQQKYQDWLNVTEIQTSSSPDLSVIVVIDQLGFNSRCAYNIIISIIIAI